MIKKIIPIYLINFLLAVSTTIGMTLIPLFATENLGMSLFVLGIIEGSTELISNLLRLVTGNLFDRTINRRTLFVFPTVMAFIAKLLLYTPSAITILMAKIIERISNGAFAAPRDAYIGEYTKNKGTALGFLSAAKTFGCILGPLIISAYTLLKGPLTENTSKIVALACFISFISIILTFFIDTKKLQTNVKRDKFDFEKMKLSFKLLLPLFILAFTFFLGRFNDGLIMLYLKNQGFPEWFYLATISFFNFVMLVISPFIGYWIDRGKDANILIITIVALISFNILFFNLNTMPWVFAGFGLMMWGIQRVGAQITFTVIIFKNISSTYYGSAIGVYSVVSGVGTFISSLLCGHLAGKSFHYIFIFSSFFSLCSLILAFRYIWKRSEVSIQ